MNDDPKRFLPEVGSLAEGRGHRLGSVVRIATAADSADSPLGWSPTSTDRLAAIVFAADVLRREAWSREVELAVPLYERYATEMPIEPGPFVAQSYKYVDTQRPARKGRCTSCAIVRGREPCIHCGASGRNDARMACAYCERGYVACSVCDGSVETVRATIRHVNDRPMSMRRAFLPQVQAARAAVTLLQEFLDAQTEPPPALRFELQATVVHSAYRGASAVRAPEFHGHEFDDALPRALDAAKEVARYRDAVKSDVRADAWPFLVLHRDAAHASAVLFHDASGEPRLLTDGDAS